MQLNRIFNFICVALFASAKYPTLFDSSLVLNKLFKFCLLYDSFNLVLFSKVGLFGYIFDLYDADMTKTSFNFYRETKLLIFRKHEKLIRPNANGIYTSEGSLFIHNCIDCSRPLVFFVLCNVTNWFFRVVKKWSHCMQNVGTHDI